jgi:SIR2-like domain
MSEKPKLLLIAGAGASVQFGMPSVSCIHELFSRWSNTDFRQATKEAPNLYCFLYEKMRQHRRLRGRSSDTSEPNFEDVLYLVYLLGGLNRSALASFVTADPLPGLLQFSKPPLTDRDVLYVFGRSLIDRLLVYFRERCINISESRDISNFINTLQMEFQIAIVTTNYDDLIYRNVQGVETGFDPADNGVFKPGHLFGRTSWPCMLHLHGSVHFDMTSIGNDMHIIRWVDDLNSKFNQNSLGRSPHENVESQDLPTSCIVCGWGKPIQLLRNPFRAYLSELDRLSDRSDRLLFLGYGFRDAHVNGAFRSYRNQRKRKVVLVDYAQDMTLTAGSGWNQGSESVVRALQVFDTPHYALEWLGYRHPESVRRLMEAREFERGSDETRPFSVWYNGLLEACRDPQRIIDELR